MRLSPSSALRVPENKVQRAMIVEQLAGGIVHDFNNILTVITGTIDILAAAVSDRISGRHRRRRRCARSRLVR
jgi:hypothetical protein